MAIDPNLFFYSDGTITLTNGSDIATGNLTAWDPAVLPFDFVLPNNGTAGMSVVKEVLGINSLVLAKPWTGPTLTNVPYFMVRWTRHTDPRVYALRVSDYLARLKAIPENLEEVAADINADAAAVAAAMAVLAQIEANVDTDRQAAQTAAGTAQGAATTATQQAGIAQQWAQAASSGVLPDNGVTNTKLADMAANTIKGRRTSTGDPEDLTVSQVKTLLSIAGISTDASGRLSMPGQPAFHAYLSASQSVFNGTATVNWTEVTDVGGNFASNKFTAPVAGIYHFDAAVTHAAGTAGQGGLALRKNGVVLADPQNEKTGAFFVASVSVSITLMLAVGDYIEVFWTLGSVTGGSPVIQPNRCLFSGYLIG